MSKVIKTPYLTALYNWDKKGVHHYNGMCTAIKDFAWTQTEIYLLNLFCPTIEECIEYGHHTTYWGESMETELEGLNDFRIMCMCFCAVINNELKTRERK